MGSALRMASPPSWSQLEGWVPALLPPQQGRLWVPDTSPQRTWVGMREGAPLPSGPDGRALAPRNTGVPGPMALEAGRGWGDNLGRKVWLGKSRPGLAWAGPDYSSVCHSPGSRPYPDPQPLSLLPQCDLGLRSLFQPEAGLTSGAGAAARLSTGLGFLRPLSQSCSFGGAGPV